MHPMPDDISAALSYVFTNALSLLWDSWLFPVLLMGGAVRLLLSMMAPPHNSEVE